MVALFESPVPASDKVGREVLTCVLCNPDLNFKQPLFNFDTNDHLRALIRGQGIPSVVWETSEKKKANARSVLDPIVHDGHEIIVDFIGTFSFYVAHTVLY
jgi:hypothetical protein